MKTAGEKQIIFFVMLCVGFLLATAASLVPFLLEGLSFEEITENPSVVYEGSASSIRLSLFLNHLFMFLLPSLIYGVLYFGKDILKGFDLEKPPGPIQVSMAILFLIACYPLVNLFHYINMQIPLMDWMKANEQNVSEMLNKIIISDSKFVLVLNVLLISLMPAIGEELVFRGILQKNFEKILKNGHIAVWISAFLFSAIHMQFEGFLARMVLGAVMGYSYYLSRNFWIPVILHSLNNLVPLLALAVMDTDLTNTMEEGEPFLWVTLILPFLGLPLLYYLYKTINGKRNIS